MIFVKIILYLVLVSSEWESSPKIIYSDFLVYYCLENLWFMCDAYEVFLCEHAAIVCMLLQRHFIHPAALGNSATHEWFQERWNTTVAFYNLLWKCYLKLFEYFLTYSIKIIWVCLKTLAHYFRTEIIFIIYNLVIAYCGSALSCHFAFLSSFTAFSVSDIAAHAKWGLLSLV